VEPVIPHLVNTKQSAIEQIACIFMTIYIRFPIETNFRF
jgi:hypothetical protein